MLPISSHFRASRWYIWRLVCSTVFNFYERESAFLLIHEPEILSIEKKTNSIFLVSQENFIPPNNGTGGYMEYENNSYLFCKIFSLHKYIINDPFKVPYQIVIIKALSQLWWGQLYEFCFSIPFYLKTNPKISCSSLCLFLPPASTFSLSYLFSLVGYESAYPNFFLLVPLSRPMMNMFKPSQIGLFNFIPYWYYP